MQTAFASEIIRTREFQGRQKRFIQHQKIYFSNSDIFISGNHSNPVSFPLISEEIRVINSFFANCLNYESDGGAISSKIVIGTPIYTNFLIESSTFYECCSFKHDGKGGALDIQGYLFLSKYNCFTKCTASSGIFGNFNIQPKFNCDLNQSTFHSNTKPGIGKGSIIVLSEYLLLVDNNFTNINIGGDGSGVISSVSYEFHILRNIFINSKGKSIVSIEIIPSIYTFQLLNFVGNEENGNGIISIISKFMMAKCYFHNNHYIVINAQDGSTLLYQCYFDSFLEKNNSIFKGSVKNKKPFWNADDGKIVYGINQSESGMNSLCHIESVGTFEEMFTPTKTPYFYGFSPNPADIIILCCIGLLVCFMIFTLIYFLWYCICSKPNLKSSIKYLKTKDADKYVDNFDPSDDIEYDSLFDLEDSGKKKNKKSKDKTITIDSLNYSEDYSVNGNTKSNSKNKDKSPSIDEYDNNSDPDQEDKSKSNKKNRSLSIDEYDNNSDPDQKPKSRFSFKRKNKSKSKDKKKSKKKSKDKDNLEDEINPDSGQQLPPEVNSISDSNLSSSINQSIKTKTAADTKSLPNENKDSEQEKDEHDSISEPEPKTVGKNKSKSKKKSKHRSKNNKSKSKSKQKSKDADGDNSELEMSDIDGGDDKELEGINDDDQERFEE